MHQPEIVADAEIVEHDPFLRRECDAPPAPFGRRQRPDVQPAMPDLAVTQRQKAVQQLEQRALPTPLRPSTPSTSPGATAPPSPRTTTLEA
jgi:hypothetical protein